MKHPVFAGILGLTGLLLAGCGGQQPAPGSTAAPDTAATTPAEPADPRPAVLLDGLYATSTAPGQDVYALFDNNPQTGWSTRDGAGPDEGIMLYFAQPTNIKRVEIRPEPGTFRDPVLPVQLYLNGKPYIAEALEGRLDIAAEEPVRALFLRFGHTGKESENTFTRSDSQIVIASLPRDARIALRELLLYNAQGESLRIVPPARLKGSVTASSTLAPEAAYSAANLFDARKEFVWVEGNKTGDGPGETLRLSFEQAVRISALKIWDGYQRSDEHYKANARLRDFEFGPAGGPFQRYTLRDDRAGQTIELHTAASGQVFELKIISAYPGKKYKDLAISELVLYDGKKPFVLQTPLPEQYRQQVAAKVAATPLDAILNRRISNHIEEPMMISDQSIILRSDGTFVLYNYWVDETDTEYETLADGNWELLEAGPKQARVKVFGKWHDLSNFVAWYQGNKQVQTTRIFNDILTIDARQVRGEKMINTFFIQQ